MGSVYDGIIRRLGHRDVLRGRRVDVADDAAAGIRAMSYLTKLFYIAIGCIAGYYAGTLVTIWAYRDEIGGHCVSHRDDDMQ